MDELLARIEKLESALQQIEERNQRVESEKAWETSLTRRVSILVITYLIASVVLLSIEAERPFLSALVPTAGFFLSTLSLPVVKKSWLESERHHSR